MIRRGLRRSWIARLSILACLIVTVTSVAQRGCSGQKPAPPDEDHYFVVLAGRSGLFYDRSGPAFVMLTKAAGADTRIDAVGIYADVNGQPVFGAVPAASYVELTKEPLDPSDVVLRIEITHSEYERALTILRTWERRAQEGALLYPDIAMDNILLVKQVTESLNASGERIDLYVLDWGLEDDISEHNLPPHIPFKYFQELRRRNEGRHVRDGDMPMLRARAEP
jgi:hypothetical protein